jgi:DNA invertase Pin-like site-specific DNA recombinase
MRLRVSNIPFRIGSRRCLMLPSDAEMSSLGVKEGLIFTGDDSAMSKLMLTIMGGVAEFERAMIKERQLEGIAKAKQAGKYRGRQSTMTAAQVRAIRDRAAAGEKKAALAREFGVTRQTIYNLIAA